MNPDLEAMREAGGKWLKTMFGINQWTWDEIMSAERDLWRKKFDMFLTLQTDKARLTVVMKDGELPENPYVKVIHENPRAVEMYEGHTDFSEGQESMLNDHWVKELRDC